MKLNVQLVLHGAENSWLSKFLPAPDLKFQLQTAFLTMRPAGDMQISISLKWEESTAFFFFFLFLFFFLLFVFVLSFSETFVAVRSASWWQTSWGIINVCVHCDALRLQKKNFWGILANRENIFAWIPVWNVFSCSRFKKKKKKT